MKLNLTIRQHQALQAMKAYMEDERKHSAQNKTRKGQPPHIWQDWELLRKMIEE